MPPTAPEKSDPAPEDQKHGVDVYAATKALDALEALEHRFSDKKQDYREVIKILKAIKSRR